MDKKTIVIINSNYPKVDNRYGDVFVHSRLKYYQQHFDIKVIGWVKGIEDHSWVYEGIHAELVNTPEKVAQKIDTYRPVAIGFHFLWGWMDKVIVRKYDVPMFVWVHGSEALGWYRRLFTFQIKQPLAFLRYMVRNTIQMFQMHNVISYANKGNRIQFIFVSDWMRRIAETDTMSRVKNVNYIPNPVDPSLFEYREKTVDFRKKILLIRSFDSRKYANDLAIDAILILSKEPFFKELSFAIYGKGRYFNKLTSKLKGFDNVQIFNHFIENKDIPSIHQHYGVFLCPTRQDAQGVSMCEAMSSGLVPITSNNTAIPEFVDSDSGFLTNSPAEIADAVRKLYNDPELFQRMSRHTARHIRSISSTDQVVSRELAMIRAAIGNDKTS